MTDQPSTQPTWRVPKLLLYRTAEAHWGVADNRYASGRIGAAFSLGRWCLSLTWKRP